MKKILQLLVVATLCFVSTTKASHVVGMHLTYQYTGTGNDYLFRLKLYRDCSGITAPVSFLINISSASCSLNLNATLTLSSFDTIPLNTCAGFGSTTCEGGTIFGFEEYNYEGFVTVPPCADWIATASLCCRNAAVTNLIDPDFYNNYVETRFDNLNFPGNSSPGFNTIPVNYYCVGTPTIKDYSAFDLDGDSLHYELVPVLDNAGSTITMAPGYTYDQPLASFTSSTLDPLNGLFLFTPSMIQISSVGYMISEYRNGALIGTVRVDDEIVVATGFVNPDTVMGRVYIDYNSNGLFDAGDQAMPNIIAHLTPGNLYNTTTGIGKYGFYTDDGIWNIAITNPPLYTTTIPASISVNTIGITFSGNNDFILDLTSNINDLEIYLNQSGNPVPGQNYPLQITYKNRGTTIQTNVDITLNLDPLLQYVSATIPPTNIAGNTLSWTIPSMLPFTVGDIDISTTVDTTAIIGTQVHCQGTISPVITDMTPGNNTDHIYDNISASCDPNYKEVFPSGDVDLPFIAAQDWLTYTIHFQNLGTAPAQIVRISDLLDPDLDFASLEMISSSYPCAMTLTSPNQLEFSFFGINLPAASVNEPASHGFVEYRIRPKSTLLPGTYITNNAAIYFDFNAPVYTNLVHNKVVTSVGIAENIENENSLSVYPNPSSDYITLEIISTDSRKDEIEIYNINGVLVKKLGQKLSEGINRVTIPVMDLSSGEYFISVIGKNGKLLSRFSVVKK